MRFVLLAAGVAAAVVLAGCGGDVPRGRVHGTVTVNGRPLTGATVIFLASDNKTHVVDLKSDGTFDVPGVAFGTVKVSVQATAPAARRPVVLKKRRRVMLPFEVGFMSASEISFMSG